MTFEIDINGRVKKVSVEPLGANGPSSDRVRVIVDGQAREVRVASTELGLALLFDDGRSVDAALTERAAGEWFVQLPKVDISASVNGRRFGHGRRGAAVKGDQRVLAPMPGRIVRVLVRAGDAVAAGQPLVVVEAMKMENELKSPRAGRVKEVSVSEGASIEAGRLLVVVE
ncbi:MAG TPA: biotin/lipoyl-containing protein [Vicinamibacterales bacterium]|nr:biotin/lipoyl-containing protein [Vicinamibacterales bacterium]